MDIKPMHSAWLIRDTLLIIYIVLALVNKLKIMNKEKYILQTVIYKLTSMNTIKIIKH